MRRLCIILIALPLAAGAQVYRCETSDGLEFTDRPCEGAVLVEFEDSAGIGLTRLESRQLREQLEAGRQARAEARQVASIHQQRILEVQQIDQQIAELRARQARANDNQAGAIYRAGIDRQIAGLHEARGRIVASRGEQANWVALRSTRR